MDDDADRLEVGVGPGPELGRSLLLLVGEQFAVAESGVVIDGVVDVPVARFGGAPVLVALLAAVDAPAAAVGDPPELLDVDVDQVTRSVVDVVVHLLACPLDPHPGRGVGPGQRWAAVAAQDLVHGRGLHPQPVRDPGRTPASGDAQPDLDLTPFRGHRLSVVAHDVGDAGPEA